MPGKFQERIGPNKLHQHDSPRTLVKDEILLALTQTNLIEALSDEELAIFVEIFDPSRYATVADVRNALAEYRDILQRAIRLWELDTQAVVIDEIQPTFLLFDPALNGAVHSVCGEEVGNEAVNVLEENGKWAHFVNEPHEIILDLGNRETIDAISVRIDAGVNASHILRGVDVFASIHENQITNLDNQVLSGVDFATLDDDNIHEFGQNKRARYVRLTNITTDDVENKLRVKNIKVRIVPRFFTEVD